MKDQKLWKTIVLWGLFKGTRAEKNHGLKSRVSIAPGLGYSACPSLTRGDTGSGALSLGAFSGSWHSNSFLMGVLEMNYSGF